MTIISRMRVEVAALEQRVAGRLKRRSHAAPDGCMQRNACAILLNGAASQHFRVGSGNWKTLFHHQSASFGSPRPRAATSASIGLAAQPAPPPRPPPTSFPRSRPTPGFHGWRAALGASQRVLRVVAVAHIATTLPLCFTADATPSLARRCADTPLSTRLATSSSRVAMCAGSLSIL